MTRINIIPVSELTDQHLIAEYREITMVPAALTRTLNSKSGFIKKKIPDRFTLNTGHVYFFYDKGLYLYNRYDNIVEEMILRGFNPDLKRIFPKDIFPFELFNDWIPTIQEQEIVRSRIKEKIAMKPSWYRKTRYDQNLQYLRERLMIDLWMI
jgi:deoxyribonuclease (pyrimidine dimer)|tara:strand:- start:23 stop:481 length:459 start_codon:yes stop_codon:yes gene_type:complete